MLMKYINFRCKVGKKVIDFDLKIKCFDKLSYKFISVKRCIYLINTSTKSNQIKKDR